MKGSRREAQYQSYLLRCWCEGGQEGTSPPAWRLSIARIGSGEAATFLCGIDDLAAYLRENLQARSLDAASCDSPAKP